MSGAYLQSEAEVTGFPAARNHLSYTLPHTVSHRATVQYTGCRSGASLLTLVQIMLMPTWFSLVPSIR
jgi:hypothetical protein